MSLLTLTLSLTPLSNSFLIFLRSLPLSQLPSPLKSSCQFDPILFVSTALLVLGSINLKTDMVACLVCLSSFAFFQCCTQHPGQFFINVILILSLYCFNLSMAFWCPQDIIWTDKNILQIFSFFPMAPFCPCSNLMIWWVKIIYSDLQKFKFIRS